MKEKRFGSFITVLAAVALTAVFGAVVLAGCGSDSGTTTNETTFSGPTPKVPGAEAAKKAKEAEAEEARELKEGKKEGKEQPKSSAAESPELALGKTTFSANCAGCHTLAEAGASGTVGPNLDELQPSDAIVEKQVTNGGAVMPAFGGTLPEEKIKAVAKYVSTVAGTEG